MTTKHTPGPWKVIDRRPHFGIVQVGKGGVIATIPSNTIKSNDEKQANAALIAAAPELLEALIDIVQAHDVKMGKSAIELRISLARAAIAKATS